MNSDHITFVETRGGTDEVVWDAWRCNFCEQVSNIDDFEIGATFVGEGYCPKCGVVIYDDDYDPPEVE